MNKRKEKLKNRSKNKFDKMKTIIALIVKRNIRDVSREDYDL